jgi:uncharacterized protein
LHFCQSWRRQCRATFQFDRIGAKLVDDIAVETLMWGSDYPHPDGVWPESSKYMEEQFEGRPMSCIRLLARTPPIFTALSTDARGGKLLRSV